MTSLVLITPPASAPNGPLSLEVIKRHLRIDSYEDDELLLQLCDAAVSHIDASGSGSLGLALMTQQWEMRLDGFPWSHPDHFWNTVYPYPREHEWRRWYRDPNEIEIPYPPLVSVDLVTYFDSAGVQQTISSTAYQIARVGTRRPSVLWPAVGASWPTAESFLSGSVTIRFTCGYASAQLIPASIRQALLLLIGHLYENREATGPNLAEMPFGFANLLAPFQTIGM